MSAPSIREFSDVAVDPKVRGFLHAPANSNGDGIVLTHGAGSNAAAPLLVALAETLSSGGFTVLRCDLPYRQSRSFGPPGPGDAARDRAGLKNALAMLCPEDPTLVSVLLLLSYPLHPPLKPEQQRTQHLPDLRTPTLFVQGTRDPFGSIAELERALKMIPAKTNLMAIEGAGHDLGFKGKARTQDLPQEIASAFRTLISRLVG
jgi:predicted alpha/beta-hydrolase family hydrolase